MVERKSKREFSMLAKILSTIVAMVLVLLIMCVSIYALREIKYNIDSSISWKANAIACNLQGRLFGAANPENYGTNEAFNSFDVVEDTTEIPVWNIGSMCFSYNVGEDGTKNLDPLIIRMLITSNMEKNMYITINNPKFPTASIGLVITKYIGSLSSGVNISSSANALVNAGFSKIETEYKNQYSMIGVNLNSNASAKYLMPNQTVIFEFTFTLNSANSTLEDESANDIAITFNMSNAQIV